MPPDKTLLRRQFRSVRRDHVAALSPEDRAAAKIALAAIVAPLLHPGAIVASYAAHRSEIDPSHVEALAPHLAFPRVTGDSLGFYRCAWPDLVPGFAGIPEPPSGLPQVIPTIVLVPLLAATPAGLRLGQGAGYYDRALAALRAAGPVLAIGLAHEVQLADWLPADSWDQPLDFVATPRRLVNCARNR
ncbi:hypothetical protein GCM10011529_10920 [Polymorphobacter glacialis]|uniref:5-formyltetrahydrofolate cyclo-ligase n=1 Tax=Sandarakinorhabdus glacialis TaxID=1614636 RepID=A0A917E7D3_9SPHN|nr:5-formyltetrahydrofolate cyclo-ligase [Polymorphobacter glacialis]GGE06374.1 hypothetical protein GCM10011529_10920 [Polymorphobacter glacialis]